MGPPRLKYVEVKIMAELKNREDIPQKDKWCLDHIYQNKEAWQAG